MGYTAPQQNAYAPNTFASEVAGAAPAPAPAAYNYNDQINMNQNNAFAPNYSNAPTTNPYYDPYNNANPPPQYGQQPQVAPQSASPGPAIFNPTAATNPQNAFPNQFSVLQQPMVQDMALQYGQRLADQGKQLVETQFEKYVPVTRLKYYFAVDNNYVVRKLILLLFPFTHRVSYALKCIFQFYLNFFLNFVSILSSPKDWSLKYDQDNPVQPRYDLNAPDLYIPTMAYITFVVLAGLVMGNFFFKLISFFFSNLFVN